MKKIINRIKYWFYVRRFHIDDFSFDQEHEEGPLHLFVWVRGRRIRVTDSHGLMDGMNITDYGVYNAVRKEL